MSQPPITKDELSIYNELYKQFRNCCGQVYQKLTVLSEISPDYPKPNATCTGWHIAYDIKTGKSMVSGIFHLNDQEQVLFFPCSLLSMNGTQLNSYIATEKKFIQERNALAGNKNLIRKAEEKFGSFEELAEFIEIGEQELNNAKGQKKIAKAFKRYETEYKFDKTLAMKESDVRLLGELQIKANDATNRIRHIIMQYTNEISSDYKDLYRFSLWTPSDRWMIAYCTCKDNSISHIQLLEQAWLTMTDEEFQTVIDDMIAKKKKSMKHDEDKKLTEMKERFYTKLDIFTDQKEFDEFMSFAKDNLEDLKTMCWNK